MAFWRIVRSKQSCLFFRGSFAMWFGVLADFVVIVHLAYVAFVVLGQLVIVAGAAFRWQWIRNVSFRLTHFTAIVIVAIEAVFGIECPLTIWEYRLRLLAGQEGSTESFVARGVHAVLFYEAPGKWVFTTAYVTFALAVLQTLWMVPPRWTRHRN